MPTCFDHKNPASVEPRQRLNNLTDVGKAVDIDFRIPPKRYYRSGVEMVRMAKVYMEEGQLENAYILFHKFITLFLEKLPSHPNYESSLPQEKKSTNQKLKEVFPLAEELKLKLTHMYAEEHKIWLEEKKIEEERLRILTEQQQREEEEQRKEVDHETEIWNLVDNNIVPNNSGSEKSDISNKLHDLHLPAEELYPSDALLSIRKEENVSKPLEPNVPPRSLKPLSVNDFEMLTHPLPSIDRSTKPSSLLSPSQFPHESKSLRRISVPKTLMSSFLNLAELNTQQNIETCGILAGKLAQNNFTVTHLLIPKQRGTSDSCSTDNEEELFSYQDQNDLITLGWIHTHPSQTAFMSSVDLHTHCSYQLMMPEAIAIVCAPKYQETGIYSLTHDYGVGFIGSCREPGFHPHPKDPPLYETSSHVQIEDSSHIHVVDLRTNAGLPKF